jgi:acyl dehydratase
VSSTVVIRAHNNAVNSENAIHADDVAQQHGFRGGLVPGVTVYAYMSGPVVDVLGPEWREHGTMAARFIKPVYDGDDITVSAAIVDDEEDGSGAAVSVVDGSGETCAVARAALPAVLRAPPDLGDFPQAPLPRARPPADESTLAPGTVLGTIAERLVREPQPLIFAELGPQFDVYVDGRVLDPVHLLRAANAILAANVKLGPWLHVGSEVTHFGLAHEGDRFELRGRVVDEFERKGHRFVALDLLMLTGDDVPVQHVRHTAIYRLARS